MFMSWRASTLSAVLTCVWLTASACKRESTSAPEPGAPSPSLRRAQVPQPAAPSSTASPVPSLAPTGTFVADDASLTRPAIERLLHHWLAAQNNGSFDDYTKLYGERFTGLKRMGSRISRMNRQSWLHDRKQMFPRIVHHFRGKDYLIIGDGATIEKPDLSSGHGTWIAFGSVDTSKNPDIDDWQGRALRVFSATGKRCVASGGKVMGIAQALPHFSEVGRWESEQVPVSQRAEIIAEMSRPQFALEIESVDADCDWLVLGQAATQLAPEVAVETADDTALRLALEAFRSLPEYRSEQRALDDFRAAVSDGAAKPSPQQAWIEYTPVTTS